MTPERRIHRRRKCLRLLRLPLLVYAGLALFAMFYVDRMIFFPPPPSYAADDPDVISFETAEGETVRAIYSPPAPGEPTLLFSHGNAEDAGQNRDLVRHFAARGWGVLAYDYPGYGRSEGRPSEASCERAIEAAWRHLTVTRGLAAGEIALVGRSVGSGPSVWLASRERAAALVLIAPFTSTFAVRPPAQYLLPGDRFPNLRRIRRIDTPLLVIHGTGDRVIPDRHGRRLFEASPAENKQMLPIPGAGHNDLDLVAGPRIRDAIAGFVEAAR